MYMHMYIYITTLEFPVAFKVANSNFDLTSENQRWEGAQLAGQAKRIGKGKGKRWGSGLVGVVIPTHG